MDDLWVVGRNYKPRLMIFGPPRERAFPSDDDRNKCTATAIHDVEFFDLGPGNPMTMQGKAALIKRYRPALEKARPRARLLNRIVDGRFVIDREQIVAGANSNSGAAIYEIVDGKIARVWFTPAVLRLRPK